MRGMVGSQREHQRKRDPPEGKSVLLHLVIAMLYLALSLSSGAKLFRCFRMSYKSWFF